MSRNYKFHNPDGVYFVSFAVVEWIDVFTINEYKQILLESLGFCQREKGMEIFAGAESSNVKDYQFWQHNNKPIELWSDKVIFEKM